MTRKPSLIVLATREGRKPYLMMLVRTIRRRVLAADRLGWVPLAKKAVGRSRKAAALN